MPVKLDAHANPLFEGKPIAYNEIKDLISNYKATLPILPNHKQDTLSAWVSVYELFSLIADNNANGVRIYFSRHPANHPDYPYHHGVVLVATYDEITPQQPTTENSNDLLNTSAEIGPISSVSFSGSGPYTGNGADAIPLCPPACPTVHL